MNAHTRIPCDGCLERDELILQLRQEMRLNVAEDQMVKLREAFGFTQAESRTVLLLYAAEDTVSAERLLRETAYDGADPNVVIVRVSHIRRKAGLGFVETIRLRGYRLGAEGRVRVVESLGGESAR